MKNFLHLYRFGEWLGEQGFNVIHPIKQADASWMQMLGIASSQELNIMLEHYYHFQAPIKAYSPRDVMKKLQDGISAYGLRINSKLDVNSKRTAESEKTIDVSWYDMYRHKHLWYKKILDIDPKLQENILEEVEYAKWYFNQTDHYCTYCGCICTNQLIPYDKKREGKWDKVPIAKQKIYKSKEKWETTGSPRLIQKLVCENCTYKKIKTRVMLSPTDTRKQILPKMANEKYYYEGNLVKEVDFLDE
jgi:hypothetical protein|tara:strand:+ start:4 stop:744 length:741 start_codon:yes stop_codon:yes gene_type:complete